MKNFHYLIWVFGYSLLLINYGCAATMPNNKNNWENTLNRCPDKPLGTLSKDDVKIVSLNNQLVKYSGSFRAGKDWGYIFEGKSGQQLTSYKTKDNICIWVYTPDNQLLTGKELPKTGKYTVQIAALKGSTTFDVEMGLNAKEKPSAPSPQVSVQTQQVKFSSGSTGASIQGTVTSTERDRYLLWCSGGQSMSIKILQGNVNMAVIAPDGSTIGLAKNGKLEWQGQLPSNGDYTVEVSATTNTSYTFNVEVQ